VTVPRESAAAPPRDVTVPRESAAAAPADVTAAPEGVASSPPRDLASPADVATRGLVVPEEGVEEFRVSRAAGAELAGPTLDDAVSRAWEGLVAGVPVACPVCHGEIEPSLGGGLQGRCGTCHAALD
jgi:hypothetical protein